MKPYYLLLSAALAISPLAQAADMTAEDAWSRSMPPSARVLPVYLTLKNHSDQTIHLTAVNSRHGNAEIHQTVMEHDMMKMLPIDSLAVPPQQPVYLAPMGLHIMVVNLVQGVPAEGELMPLTLIFDNGDRIHLEAPVKTMP